jgi:hypothetical protein
MCQMPRYRATPSADGCDPWSKPTSPQRGLNGDGYELIAPNGYVLTKQEYLADIESGQLRYQIFEPASEIVVRGGGQLPSCATGTDHRAGRRPACVDDLLAYRLLRTARWRLAGRVVAGHRFQSASPPGPAFPGVSAAAIRCTHMGQADDPNQVPGLSASARPGAEGEEGTARWRKTCGVTVRLPGISYDVVRNSRHPLPAEHTGTQRQRRHEPNYARRRYWTARITFSTGSFPEFH